MGLSNWWWKLSKRALDSKERKGKEYVTIEKDNDNKGFFQLQKDEEKRLSLSASQAKLTYRQLIEFGYKLRKPKIEFANQSSGEWLRRYFK